MALIHSRMTHLQNLEDDKSQEEATLAFGTFEREWLFELDDELADWSVDEIYQCSDTPICELEATYTIWQRTMGDIEWFPSA